MTDNGLRIESAASVIAREHITKFFEVFGHVIRRDRAANQSVVAAYIDGLAGAVAMTIAGGHASKEEATLATVNKLLDAIDRDLRHLARN